MLLELLIFNVLKDFQGKNLLHVYYMYMYMYVEHMHTHTYHFKLVENLHCIHLSVLLHSHLKQNTRKGCNWSK